MGALVVPETGAIAAGPVHTLAIKADGSVWAWGNNNSGQLGDGTTTIRTSPVRVANANGIVAVSAGRSHSLALDHTGAVWAWGSNVSGELGDGTTVMRTRPKKIENLDDIVAISAGGLNFSLALKSDGTVWAWGSNFSGKLGDTTRTPRLRPTQVVGLGKAIAIAAGNEHALALLDDGSVWSWGSNYAGQLGIDTMIDRATPVRVPHIEDAVAISASTLSHSLVVKKDGTVWGWGNNVSGQLGVTIDIIQLPIQVPGLSEITGLSSGSSHGVAQGRDGTLYVWGSNYAGQLGPIPPVDHVKPTPFKDAPTDIVAAVAAGNRTVVLTRDGAVYSAGNNDQGQWGDGTVISLNGINETAGYSPTGLAEPSSHLIGSYAWHQARDFATLPNASADAASH